MVKFRAFLSFLVKQRPGQKHQDLVGEACSVVRILERSVLTSSGLLAGLRSLSSLGRKQREGHPGDLPASWPGILFKCGIVGTNIRVSCFYTESAVLWTGLHKILSDHLNILVNKK